MPDFTDICPARKSGYTIGNADVDSAAAIAVTKIGTRTLYLSFPPQSMQNTGTVSNSGVFPTVCFDDATQRYSRLAFALPAEYSSGAISVDIYWITAATTGDAKFTVDIKSTTTGGTTASENQQTIATTTDATANEINKSTVSFAASLLASGDIVGIQITRDGTDAADTIGADLYVLLVVVSYTGRG